MGQLAALFWNPLHYQVVIALVMEFIMWLHHYVPRSLQRERKQKWCMWSFQEQKASFAQVSIWKGKQKHWGLTKKTKKQNQNWSKIGIRQHKNGRSIGMVHRWGPEATWHVLRATLKTPDRTTRWRWTKKGLARKQSTKRGEGKASEACEISS